MVCMDTVRRTDLVWQCRSCWAIFHLTCITRWSSASASAAVPEAEGGHFAWSCPGCRHVLTAMPGPSCFCGKETDPEALARPGAHAPHSCGQQCGRLRAGTSCPHACTLVCHPGPCPPCAALGPLRTCHCGKHAYRLRCGEDDGGVSCGAVCGRALACGKHRCERVCHPGPCGPCPHTELQSCHCGKVLNVQRPCGSGDSTSTTDDSSGNGGTVLFSCGAVCGKMLACGKHRCERVCHAGPCGPCALVTTPTLTCPCGKARVVDLLAARGLPPRTACDAPLPLCGAVCGRARPHCAHACPGLCHAGPCPPCAEPVRVACRCGATTTVLPCWRVTADPAYTQPRCETVCRARKNCRRHVCSERCCPARGHSGTDAADPVAAAHHTCLLVCGRPLPCGHTCEQLCHRGACPPCSHLVLEPLACACGKTVLLPPQPCGTAPPVCHEVCRRPRACGHVDALGHPCHYGPCPPCVALVDKLCCGGHRLVHSVPCSRTNVCCGERCAKPLPCGQHTCQRICHPGPCIEEEEEEEKAETEEGKEAEAHKSEEEEEGGQGCARGCGQVCGKPLPVCGHACTMLCHPGTPCGTEGPCQALVEERCACGHRVACVPCLVRNDDAAAVAAARAASWDGTLAAPPRRVLECNDECKQLQRRRALAEALGVSPLRGAPEYGDFLVQYAVSRPATVRRIEAAFAALLAPGAAETAALEPMDIVHRRVVHMLAKFYRVASFSEGRFATGRYVVLTRQAASEAPRVLLSEVAAVTRPASSRFPVQPSVDGEDPLYVLRLASPAAPLDPLAVAAATARHCASCDVVRLDKSNTLVVCKEMATLNAIRLQLLPLGIVVD